MTVISGVQLNELSVNVGDHAAARIDSTKEFILANSGNLTLLDHSTFKVSGAK